MACPRVSLSAFACQQVLCQVPFLPLSPVPLPHHVASFWPGTGCSCVIACSNVLRSMSHCHVSWTLARPPWMLAFLVPPGPWQMDRCAPRQCCLRDPQWEESGTLAGGNVTVTCYFSFAYARRGRRLQFKTKQLSTRSRTTSTHPLSWRITRFASMILRMPPSLGCMPGRCSKLASCSPRSSLQLPHRLECDLLGLLRGTCWLKCEGE